MMSSDCLTSVVGLAAALKYVVIPAVKTIQPAIQGRLTVGVAFVAGVALALLLTALAGRTSPGDLAEAAITGLAAAASAIGANVGSNALRRRRQGRIQVSDDARHLGEKRSRRSPRRPS
jgi:hypothetical protein